MECELTEKKGGGLGKSAQGEYLMSPGDYPEEIKKIEDRVEEVTNKLPSSG